MENLNEHQEEQGKRQVALIILHYVTRSRVQDSQQTESPIARNEKCPTPINSLRSEIDEVVVKIQAIDSEKVKSLVKIVYDRVVIEHIFCQPFAELVKTLHQLANQPEVADSSKENLSLFKKAVLDLCEAKYRAGLVAEMEIKNLAQQFATSAVLDNRLELKRELEKRYLYRKQYFDNVWMIAAVYDVGLLSTDIIVSTLNGLFGLGYYEYLAKFITAMGKGLEENLRIINPTNAANWSASQKGFKPDSMYMVKTAMKIRSLSTNGELDLDTRLQLLDVYKLWKNNWVLRKLPKRLRRMRRKAVQRQRQIDGNKQLQNEIPTVAKGVDYRSEYATEKSEVATKVADGGNSN